MIIVGSSDIAVVAYAHGRPELLEIVNDRVNVFFRRNALFLCFKLNFLTVLVSSRQKHYIIALHSFEARDSIARNGRIAVTDVRLTRGVVNRSRYIIFFAHFATFLSVWGKIRPKNAYIFLIIIPHYDYFGNM